MQIGHVVENPEKSTTGCIIVLDKQSVKSWSKTQALIVLSSGEFEFYVTLKASAETLGIVSMLNDYGVKVGGCSMGGCTSCPRDYTQKGPGQDTPHPDRPIVDSTNSR